MPADVELFDMLHANVLEAMTEAQLAGEIRRVAQMQDRVTEYMHLIMDVLKTRMEQEK